MMRYRLSLLSLCVQPYAALLSLLMSCVCEHGVGESVAPRLLGGCPRPVACIAKDSKRVTPPGLTLRLSKKIWHEDMFPPPEMIRSMHDRDDVNILVVLKAMGCESDQEAVQAVVGGGFGARAGGGLDNGMVPDAVSGEGAAALAALLVPSVQVRLWVGGTKCGSRVNSSTCTLHVPKALPGVLVLAPAGFHVVLCATRPPSPSC